MISRPPLPALRRFVRLVWASDAQGAVESRLEHVLPTGHMHIVIRLGGPAVRVFGGERDLTGQALDSAIIAGARSCYYVRRTAASACAVGALLEPGAAAALFGAPADAFTGRHTALADLLGAEASEWIDRLSAAPTLPERLARFEALVARCLRGAAEPHAAVRRTLDLLRSGEPVRQAVEVVGFSHKHLITLFRQETGLAPKEYGRVLRLQAALAGWHRAPAMSASEASLVGGYSDQAHFSRECQALAGLTPSAWRRASPVHPNHVPVLPSR
jgi:AraC-like DNA-binding protein